MIMYEKFSDNVLMLLAIYTLFDTQEIQPRKLKSVMENLLGRSLSDLKAYVKPLRDAYIIEAKTYNWRTDSYDYTIASEHMVPVMLFLKEQKKDLTLKVLDAAKAAYLATLIEKGQETVERFPATPLAENLQIEPVLTNKLNKLRIGLPEAYYYWAKTSQLLAK